MNMRSALLVEQVPHCIGVPITCSSKYPKYNAGMARTGNAALNRGSALSTLSWVQALGHELCRSNYQILSGILCCYSKHRTWRLGHREERQAMGGAVEIHASLTILSTCS